MEIRTKTGLAVLLICSAAFSNVVSSDDARNSDTQQTTDSFLVRVDEYELSEPIGPEESIEQILAMVGDVNRKEGVSRSTTCAVTVVCGVPARSSHSRQIAFLQPTTSGTGGNVVRSYEYLSAGTSLDVLLTENNENFKVDIRYESSVCEDATAEDTPPGESSTELESTHYMKAGDIRLCGILEGGATRVITVRLQQ